MPFKLAAVRNTAVEVQHVQHSPTYRESLSLRCCSTRPATMTFYNRVIRVLTRVDVRYSTALKTAVSTM